MGDSRRAERYWVHLSDGEFFPIFSSNVHKGQWHQLFAPHLNYLTPELAIIDALKAVYAKVDKLSEWRKCRAKVQTFSFDDRSNTQLRLPAKSRRVQPRTARKA